MTSHAITTNFQRATAVAGAVFCLVIIMAMFSGPTQQRAPISFSPAAPVPTVAPIFQFTAESILGLMVIGLISGTFGGMLGMGGGVLKMSFLLFFFGFHTGVSRFAALLAYFIVATGASYQYLKLKFVMMDVVKILIPSSILGIVVGAIIGHYLPRDIMTLLLGSFLLFISVVMVKRIVSRHENVLAPTDKPALKKEPVSPPDHPAGGHSGWKIGLCGFPGGFLCAMLGISGGVVTTPLQQVLARIPIKNSIANTLLKASVTVPIACLMILVMGVRAGHFDFWTPVLVALCLIPGSIIGSQLGPALNKRMSPFAIHTLFCVVALFMGINMLFFNN